jgi:hypothetical protein
MPRVLCRCLLATVVFLLTAAVVAPGVTVVGRGVSSDYHVHWDNPGAEGSPAA